MSKILSDVSYYVADKISFQLLNENTYVGMDNMIPNRGGITVSEYVPCEGQFTHFKKGDILLGNIRPYFKKIWLAEYNGGCSPDVLCIRAKDGVSPLFLYAVLAQDSFFDYDIKGAKGSKMPRGDKEHIMAYPVPNIDNAEEVGVLINLIYQKIKNNNAICANLESMAKLIYDYWFVQFDFPDENGKPYKSSGGKMVWNEELKREIPDGWEVKHLGNFDTCVGGTPNRKEKKYWNNGTIPWIKTEEINNTIISLCNECITDAGMQNSAAKIIPAGNVIMAMYGTGTAGRVGFLPYDATTNQACCAIICNDENDSAFVYFFCKSIWDYINRIITGSIQQNLNKEMINSFAFAYPPHNILRASHLNMIIKKLVVLSEENQQLTSLRDFLLPMLMNGQVKVGA